MAFLLFHVDPQASCYRLVAELISTTSLWGRSGVLSSCAARQSQGPGPWTATEADLLGELLHRIPALAPHSIANLAILDDLVPRGPERIVGRIVRINGYLDGEYNPLLITMSEVLNVHPPTNPQERATFVRPELGEIPLPGDDRPLIRTVNYLLDRWRPPRAFSGALLWPRHWDYLRTL
jgi:hypothetical protein